MQKNKKKKSTKLRNILCILICIGILGVFFALIASQTARYNALRAQNDNIQSNLAREMAIYEDLRYQMAHFDSATYIEALARERFGWVHPNEIVLRMVTD